MLAVVGGVALYLSFGQPAPASQDWRLALGTVDLQATNSAAEVLPLGEPPSLPAERVALGRLLFHDARLSGDNSVSCASCHPLDKGGMDGLRVSRGVAGRQGEFNAPTVFNSALNFRQFWDGRARDLEEQVSGPIHSSAEMDSDWSGILARIGRDARYQRLSRRAYGRPLDAAVIANALASFERGLITPDAPFDHYLRGDHEALRDKARKGWALFRQLGCVACHQGVNLGGNMYAPLGLMGDYFDGRVPKKSDLGRYNVTGREEDKHLFKVPGLRNVARTAPYFHDGGVATLEEAVTLMARYQLGLELAAAEREYLLAFLDSLTGRWPEPP